MLNSKRPPRVSIIRRQYETVYEHLLRVLNSSQKPNRSTQEQLWDIYKLLSEMQSSIIAMLGDPPADIKASNETLSMSRADVTSMFESFTKQYEERLKLERCSTNKVIERVTTITEREEVADISENVKHTVSKTTAAQQASQTVMTYKPKYTSDYSRGYKSECTKLLKRMCDYKYESSDAKEIVQLMNKWYNLRFNTNYLGQKYTYGVNQITEGFYTILFAYTEHKLQNTVPALKNSFNKWADSLTTNPEAAKSWTMPYQLNPIMNDIHNNLCDNIVVHPQTIILWWAIIAPFISDIERISAKYDVFINPEFIETTAYEYGYDSALADASSICPDKHVNYSVLLQCHLD